VPLYRIEWLEDARADVRRLDRRTAMRIFDGILHFSRTGGGDFRKLTGEFAGTLRLRIGDYRVLFTLEKDVIRVFGVRHRSEAYR
jgi:mRNA interferase RelE/StbE